MKLAKADWRTHTSLKPYSKGALKESEKYGEALICVRYRYDEATRRRIKTVELIIEERTLPLKVAAVDVDVPKKRCACRLFVTHYRGITTCVNCGWPKVNHKQV